jgi:hypothetical protein
VLDIENMVHTFIEKVLFYNILHTFLIRVVEEHSLISTQYSDASDYSYLTTGMRLHYLFYPVFPLFFGMHQLTCMLKLINTVISLPLCKTYLCSFV